MKTFTTKSGKQMTIREPRVGDVEQLMHFINELVDEDVPILMNERQTLDEEEMYLLQQLQFIQDEAAVLGLVFDGDKLVANASVHKRIWKQSHVGVFGIAILQQARGDRVGYTLANHVIQEAKERLGIRIIELTVVESNINAIRLYEKLGFVSSGRLPEGILHRGEYLALNHMYLKL